VQISVSPFQYFATFSYPAPEQLLTGILVAASFCQLLADEAIFGEAESESVEPIVTKETKPNEGARCDSRISSNFVRNAGKTTGVHPRTDRRAPG